MTIKEFQEQHKGFCNKYNEQLDLFYRCSEFIEAQGRTDKEIDKFCKMLNVYSEKISLMIIEYKTITGEELSKRITLGGFLIYEVIE